VSELAVVAVVVEGKMEPPFVATGLFPPWLLPFDMVMLLVPVGYWVWFASSFMPRLPFRFTTRLFPMMYLSGDLDWLTMREAMMSALLLLLEMPAVLIF
jgi:hypothetical protein